MDITLRLPGPHVLLLAGREEIAHVHGLPLEPLAASALVEAIRPRDVPAAIRRRVEAAASRSRGLPGKFVSLLWGTDSGQVSRFKAAEVPRGGFSGVIGMTGRVAERSPAYGVGSSTAPDGTEPARSPSWAAPRELAVLRRRLEAATRQLDAGRHAPGDRLLRCVIGGLARRHDWLHAHGGAIALAGSLLKRGRPQDARARLADAKDYATRAGQDAAVIEIAILTGVAWTDLARLDDAEGVLQAALAASRSSERRPGSSRRGWRSRAVCSGAAGTPRPHAPRVDGSPRGGGRDGGRGCRGFIPHRGSAGEISAPLSRARTRRSTSPNGWASLRSWRERHAPRRSHTSPSATASASTVTSIEPIRAARAARDPLSALRARLLAAESARRGGAWRDRRPRCSGGWEGFHGESATDRPRALRAPRGPAVGRIASAEVVRRHVAATRLEALALFAPERRAIHAAIAGRGRRCCRDPAIVPDRGRRWRCPDGCVRAAPPPPACGGRRILRPRAGRTRAAGVGRQRASRFRIGDRVVAAGQLITPHLREGSSRGNAGAVRWRCRGRARRALDVWCASRRASRVRAPHDGGDGRRSRPRRGDRATREAPAGAPASCSASAARWWRCVTRSSAQPRRPLPS